MVSIIPINEQVDNIIFANATIDDSFDHKLHELPVAVLVDSRQHLIGEKLSVCFKIKETCFYGREKFEIALNNAPKIIFCLAASGSCGYILYCTHCLGCPCCP